MNHKLLLFYSWFVWASTYFLPDMPLIRKLRGRLYQVFIPSCGTNFQVSSGCRLIGLENLILGNDVYFASDVIINANDIVEIHDEVMLGFRSILVSGNHSKLNGSYRRGPSLLGPIVICQGSWIGANCVLAAGARFPPSSVLGANSFFSKNIQEIGIYAGAPAVRINKSGKNR